MGNRVDPCISDALQAGHELGVVSECSRRIDDTAENLVIPRRRHSEFEADCDLFIAIVSKAVVLERQNLACEVGQLPLGSIAMHRWSVRF